MALDALKPRLLDRTARAVAERILAPAARLAGDPDHLRKITGPPRNNPHALPSPLTGLRELVSMGASAYGLVSGVALTSMAITRALRNRPERFERDYAGYLMLGATRYAAALDCDVTFEGVEAVEQSARDNLIGIFLYHTSLLPDCFLPWIHPTLARHMRIWADQQNFHDNPLARRVGLDQALDGIHQIFIVRGGNGGAEASRLRDHVVDSGIWPCISPHAGRLQRRYDFDGRPIAPGFYTAVQGQPEQYLAALPGLAFANLIQQAQRPMSFFVLKPKGAEYVMPKRFGSLPGLFMEPVRTGRSIRFVLKPVGVFGPIAADSGSPMRKKLAREINNDVERVMAGERGIDAELEQMFGAVLEREELRARLTTQQRDAACARFAELTVTGKKTHLVIFDRILAIPLASRGLREDYTARLALLLNDTETTRDAGMKSLLGDVTASKPKY